MKVQTELETKREATNYFIQDNPITIPLTRNDRVRTPTGGYKDEERTLVGQDFRIVGSAGLNQPEAQTNVGTVANYGIQIVGYWDADVEDGDEFTINGGRYKVTFVYPDRAYRTIAQANYQGALPSG